MGGVAETIVASHLVSQFIVFVVGGLTVFHKEFLAVFCLFVETQHGSRQAIFRPQVAELYGIVNIFLVMLEIGVFHRVEVLVVGGFAHEVVAPVLGFFVMFQESVLYHLVFAAGTGHGQGLVDFFGGLEFLNHFVLFILLKVKNCLAEMQFGPMSIEGAVAHFLSFFEFLFRFVEKFVGFFVFLLCQHHIAFEMVGLAFLSGVARFCGLRNLFFVVENFLVGGYGVVVAFEVVIGVAFL